MTAGAPSTITRQGELQHKWRMRMKGQRSMERKLEHRPLSYTTRHSEHENTGYSACMCL